MILCSVMSLIGMAWINAEVETLPNTQPLTMEGDLATQMVDGIDRFFITRKLQRLHQAEP